MLKKKISPVNTAPTATLFPLQLSPDLPHKESLTSLLNKMKQLKLVEHLTPQQRQVKPMERVMTRLRVTLYTYVCAVCVFTVQVCVCTYVFLPFSQWVSECVCVLRSNRDFAESLCHLIINTYRSFQVVVTVYNMRRHSCPHFHLSLVLLGFTGKAAYQRQKKASKDSWMD